MAPFRFFIALVVLLGAGSPVRAEIIPDPPPPGQWRLNVRDDRISLWADQVPLAALLAALDEATPGELVIHSVPDRRVSLRGWDLSLDEILNRLDVNYVLTFHRAERDGSLRLDRALVNGERADPAAARVADRLRRLVGHLASDDVGWNAHDSRDQLREMGEAAIPELERGLREGDYQVRQFAADVLAGLGPDYAPSHRFLEALVEGLADDEFPAGTNTYNYLFNARRGLDYFCAFPEQIDRARPLMERALYAADPQQRFLCAFLLAGRGDTRHLPRLAKILIPHLRDNDMGGDGGMAAYALYRLGPGIRPQLAPLTRSDDAQQAELAALILYHLDHPAAPSAPIKMNHYHGATRNPVMHLLEFVFWGWTPENFPAID
jgi:HEAT repeat protein